MRTWKRYLERQVQRDLNRKMVFVGGPRQVGKTTMSRRILGRRRGYLNWDIPEDREAILKRILPDTSMWVFDELHKYRKWRNYLKGLYDQYYETKKILVTGSARLDLYRFGGDSLQGRYHYLRLHPFSAGELGIDDQDGMETLLHLGGFPEPFLGGSEVEARRWSREYRARLIEEEIGSLERIQDLGTLELLMLRLPELVGSPLSINALREDLQVAHSTVAGWLEVFERTYAIFRLSPFGAPRIRAVKKERKHYHFDWTLVEEPAARFEKMVACHLLKWVHFQQDSKGEDIELRYFRDVDRREVDFVLTRKNRPIQFIECKLGDTGVDRGLRYLKERFPEVPAFQVSLRGKTDRLATREKIRLLPAWRYLRNLV
ncbi:MAG: ATP-binding protein [Candidatus Hydrogenedentota bacterium]|nr:MAG: ATP-binding protein [Candidatus Hydrogenedentota bacterium]